MPDYRTLLKPGDISIATAIRAGRRDIQRNSRLILTVAGCAGLLLSCFGLSLWTIPICVFCGMVVDVVYSRQIVPKWRIWAYAGVADIHQFQRCAELENLLPRNSVLKNVGRMDADQKARLALLQQRFHEELPFIDDAEVTQAVHIYEGGWLPGDPSRPFINISREGITLRQHGFFPWSAISNEHIGFKSYSRGLFARSSSGAACFCFTGAGILIEIRMSRLAIGLAELDQILYIQRGRYENDRAGLPMTIPLKPQQPDFE